MRLLRHLRAPASLPRLIWKNITYPFTRQAAEQRYDRRLGIETTGWVEPQDMDIDGETAQHAHAYIPTPPRIAQFLIAQVAERARGFTFVDVGSGKGRVLFIAARFAFRRVVGLEHSATLNEIATENARRFASLHPDAAPVELLTGDATQLPLPDGPLVVFLFNPFGREILAAFAQALKSAHNQAPRKVICIYYNALFPELLTELGIFTRQERVDYPADSLDHFSQLDFPAMIFET
jgi:SAM-dependent methyltransferase